MTKEFYINNSPCSNPLDDKLINDASIGKIVSKCCKSRVSVMIDEEDNLEITCQKCGKSYWNNDSAAVEAK